MFNISRVLFSVISASKHFIVFYCSYLATVLPIFVRVTSLTYGQMHDCGSASQVIPKNSGTLITCITADHISITQQNTAKTMCVLQGIYCVSDEICQTHGLYSLSGRTSCRKISWSLEAARLDIIMIISLLNLTGISALPRCLSNFGTIGKV